MSNAIFHFPWINSIYIPVQNAHKHIWYHFIGKNVGRLGMSNKIAIKWFSKLEI